MNITERKPISEELALEAEEIAEMLKNFTHQEKERIFYMMKGVELLHEESG